MKKLINGIDDVVREQLQGMAAAHPELSVHIDPHYIVRGDAPVAGKVAVISGGGSGHEPMHGGFVGVGMLDGACPGEVFTSPTPDQMYECGMAANSGAGVLFLVKNYTGDVMNFEMAAEMLAAEGVPVQSILIDDDVAVKDSLYTAGRRGVGTTVIIEKIVGAAAEAGYNLDQCADLARKVNSYGRSMGMALTSCIVPAAGKPTFDLGDDEIEIGIGIHGEPGQKRMPMTSADAITEMMALEIIEDDAYTRTVREWDTENGIWVELELTDEPLAAGDSVIAFVNSMGGTPVSELYAVYRKLAAVCEDKGITIARNLIGPYITSLEMQGFSITLVKVDDEILKFWDAPVNTPGLRWGA
ncbi:MAG: dihydroxyacetone kinase subunit DhaK [Anaerolineae bacterium]|nr:dihydroxyacetone kinase subunit DhaK [Anaerolineae bacterium]MCO5189514.1 dihydroxyacetone kinase subunit DhaK [Anaerolineae bacterium]MCO5195664.1 dihydroxyacetone kinase subunit DhaK [Anaerolineae bacterium]MCO5196815.1 dihydroxyacetone kinase subunit DhaK [Anaerolineae bacterium]MCO5205101.1 dihydroxyacetone kinase subunit DhaK [Anaerolineae bacterium]